MTAAHEHARENADRYREQLFELLRIPSVSTDDARKGEVRRAGEWVAADLARIGIDNARVMETAGHPVVYGGGSARRRVHPRYWSTATTMCSRRPWRTAGRGTRSNPRW